MEEHYIYCLTNKLDGKMYFGQTQEKNIKQRWKRGKAYNHSSRLFKSIEKDGWDNFYHDVLFVCPSADEADELEDYLIRLFDTVNEEKGYNQRYGGRRGKHTKEYCAKRSISQKGKHYSPNSEFKKGTQVGKSTWFKKGQLPWCAGTKGQHIVKAWNKGLTKETDPRIAKYANAKKGMKFSDEARKHMSEAHKKKEVLN